MYERYFLVVRTLFKTLLEHSINSLYKHPQCFSKIIKTYFKTTFLKARLEKLSQDWNIEIIN